MGVRTVADRRLIVIKGPMQGRRAGPFMDRVSTRQHTHIHTGPWGQSIRNDGWWGCIVEVDVVRLILGREIRNIILIDDIHGRRTSETRCWSTGGSGGTGGTRRGYRRQSSRRCRDGSKHTHVHHVLRWLRHRLLLLLLHWRLRVDVIERLRRLLWGIKELTGRR